MARTVKGKGWRNNPTDPGGRRHGLSARGIKNAPTKAAAMQKSMSMKKENESHLTIVPVYVPRGKGNNPMAGKSDLLYKIREWGFIFPTRELAEKYADEHIEKNGIIIKRTMKNKQNAPVRNKNCYAVKNKRTGSVKARCSTLNKTKAQKRLLESRKR